jgi:hypothetical protein
MLCQTWTSGQVVPIVQPSRKTASHLNSRYGITFGLCGGTFCCCSAVLYVYISYARLVWYVTARPGATKVERRIPNTLFHAGRTTVYGMHTSCGMILATIVVVWMRRGFPCGAAVFELTPFLTKITYAGDTRVQRKIKKGEGTVIKVKDEPVFHAQPTCTVIHAQSGCYWCGYNRVGVAIMLLFQNHHSVRSIIVL